MLKVSTNNPIKRYKPIVRKGVYFYITKFYSVSLFCFSQFEAHSTQVSCFKFKSLRWRRELREDSFLISIEYGNINRIVN